MEPEMQYRFVGRTGLRISTVSLGGWLTYGGSVDGASSFPIFRRAAASGINFIDLADVYSNGNAERVFGAFLRDWQSGEGRRSDFVISSKVYWGMGKGPNDRGLSRKHIMESCEASLKRLGTDYLDLYFCHRYDTEVPLAETVRAMEDLVAAGKVLHWGTSVWEAEQIRSGMELSRVHHGYGTVVEQPRYNLLDRHIEASVVPACLELGVGIVVWSPLAQGLLTGKYNDGIPAGSRGAQTAWLERELTPSNLERIREFCVLAAESGLKPGQLALKWALDQPGITSVIMGATDEAQVMENAAAAVAEVDAAVYRRLDELFPA
jgi:aryl-alcohol dehydrogenase-like predicted oxidoreductase